MLLELWNEEDGVILSAELVLIGTILLLGMIVGLVELQSAVVAELTDLGSSFGNLDQSYQTPGVTSYKFCGQVKASTAGASFRDSVDSCDCNAVITCDATTSRGEGTHKAYSYGAAIDGRSTAFTDAGGMPVDSHEINNHTPPTPIYTEEEVQEMERIRMERRVFERFKVEEHTGE